MISAKQNSNKYEAGGFVIETTFSFSCLEYSKETSTGTWSRGKVPYPDKINENESPLIAIEDSYFYRVFHLAKIEIRNDDNVVIELLVPEQEDHLNTIALHILGLLAQKKNKFPLHAAAICYKGQAYLFTGLSGAGKSTCAKALSDAGFEYISDEHAPLIVHDNKLHLQVVCTSLHWAASPLQEKKWQRPLRQNTYKTLPVHTIYALELNTDHAVISNKNTFDAIKILQENHFKPFLQWNKQHHMQRYRFCIDIVEKCTIKAFARPKNTDNLLQNLQILIEDIRSNS